MTERHGHLIERPEYVRPALGRAVTGDVARPLSLAARLAEMDPVRKFTVLLAAIVIWEVYTRAAHVPELIFPSFDESIAALWRGLVQYDLAQQIWASLKVLAIGYAIGLAIGAVLSFLAVTSRFGGDVLGTLTAMLNPLPAIALLPLALIWFGLGIGRNQ